jgi:hypothetical protein
VDYLGLAIATRPITSISSPDIQATIYSQKNPNPPAMIQQISFSMYHAQSTYEIRGT